jgi:hypothetical protein
MRWEPGNRPKTPRISGESTCCVVPTVPSSRPFSATAGSPTTSHGTADIEGGGGGEGRPRLRTVGTVGTANKLLSPEILGLVGGSHGSQCRNPSLPAAGRRILAAVPSGSRGSWWYPGDGGGDTRLHEEAASCRTSSESGTLAGPAPSGTSGRPNVPPRHAPDGRCGRPAAVAGQAGKRQWPGAPGMPWRTGPLSREDPPGPVRAVGSVVTYRVCRGSGRSASRATRGRMRRNPFAPESRPAKVGGVATACASLCSSP